MTDQEKLQQAKSNLIQAYLDMSVQPRPDGSGEGSSIQWTALRKSLQEEIQKLDVLILAIDSPFEIVTVPLSE